MYELLSVILIVFGILQIVLFFKIWGMTNDVNRIKTTVEKANNQDLSEAEAATLMGNYNEAFDIYYKCFVSETIEIYNRYINKVYGEAFNQDDQLEYRKVNYKKDYEKSILFYKNRIEKLDKSIDFEKYDSLDKMMALLYR